MATYEVNGLSLVKDDDTYLIKVSSKAVFYGTSSTAAATQTKVVSITDFESPSTGMHISIKFTNAQTYNGKPKLNINSTGAVSVDNGFRYMWEAGEVVDFVYNGTYWLAESKGLATTSKYGVTKLASEVSTSSTTAITPSAVNDAMTAMNAVATQVMTGATASSNGSSGRVPAPAAGDQNKVLQGDGTWGISPGAKVYSKTVTITNISGAYSGTFEDENISSDMKAIELEVEDTSVIGDNIVVTTNNGSVGIACNDISGTTAVTISLLKVINDPTQITSTEFTVLNNRLLSVENVCIDVPITIRTTDWISDVNGYSYIWESEFINNTCEIDVFLRDGAENAGIEEFDFDKVANTVQFTSSVLPTGNLPVMIRVINAKADAFQNLTGTDIATDVISGADNVDEALAILSGVNIFTGIKNDACISAIEGRVNKMGHFVSGFFILTPSQNVSDNTTVFVSGLPKSYYGYVQMPMVILSGENIGKVGRVRITVDGTITSWYSSFELRSGVPVLIPVNYICEE